MFGNRKVSFYGLVYHRTFPIGGITSVLSKDLLQSYSRSLARRKVGIALRSRTRKFDQFKRNELKYFYREALGGFVGPAKVESTLRVHVNRLRQTKESWKEVQSKLTRGIKIYQKSTIS